MDFYTQLHMLLCRDATGRGLAGAAPAPDFAALTASLLTAERAVILTGFPVDCGGSIRGETDGPGGAAELARALLTMGCAVTVLTDRVSLPQVRAAVDCMAPAAELACLPAEDPRPFGEALLRRVRPTHFLSIERPGKGRDGHFHSMRGTVIDPMVIDSDFLLPLARSLGAVTVAVGDGGNELGMGAHWNAIVQSVPHGGEIASVEAADFALVAGVSNWWAWGVGALLSLASGRRLLPTLAEERRLLAAVVASGGVDGCTRRPALSVDAQPLEAHQLLLRRIRGALDAAETRYNQEDVS